MMKKYVEFIINYPMIVVFLVIALLFMIPSPRSDHVQRAKLLKCKNNLKGLFKTLLEYNADNYNHYPPAGNFLPSLDEINQHSRYRFQLLVCPAKPTDFKLDQDKFTDEDIIRFSSYVETQDQIDEDTPEDKPIIWDRKDNHEGYRNVLDFGGEIERAKEEEFQKLLKEHEEEHKRKQR